VLTIFLLQPALALDFEPVELADSTGQLVGMPWEAYAPYRDYGILVALDEAEATEGRLFGLNAVLLVGGEQKNLSFALSWKTDVPDLRVDRDADGHLADDERVPLEKSAVGDWVSEEELASGAPIRWRIPAGSKEVALLKNLHWRRGVLHDGEKTVAVRIEGRNGIFDRDSDVFAVDLDGDGKLSMDGDSPETFRNEVGLFNWNGKTWKYAVDRDGAHAKIEETESVRGRASLAVGTAAPDFQISGEKKLSDLRGQRTVLNFWSPHCGFCIAQGPVIAKAVESGLSVVSITDVSTESAERSRGEWKASWTSVAGQLGEAAWSEYRVSATPAYYVVDEEGHIVAKGTGALDWPEIDNAARLQP